MNAPQGLVCNSTGTLYIASGSGNTVSYLNSSGSLITFASGFNNPEGLAFDSIGNLYVANGGASGANSVIKVHLGAFLVLSVTDLPFLWE